MWFAYESGDSKQIYALISGINTNGLGGLISVDVMVNDEFFYSTLRIDCLGCNLSQLIHCDSKRFYQRRLAPTMPLFYFTNTISIVVCWLFSNIDQSSLTPFVIPSWFASTIWFFYYRFKFKNI